MADSKQREIKFRLIKDGKIVGYELWLITPEGWKWVYSQHPNSIVWQDEPIDHEFKEPLVGLQDRNGKDIFEGDIFQMFEYRWLVRWSVSECRFEGSRKAPFGTHDETTLIYADKSDHITIVGSIHENPELLKGSND